MKTWIKLSTIGLALLFSCEIISTVVGVSWPKGYLPDVDLEELYGEATWFSDKVSEESFNQIYGEDGEVSITSTKLSQLSFSANSSIPEFTGFEMEKGKMLFLGNFSELCPECWDDFTYTFASWVSLMPNSVKDIQSYSTCTPWEGPCGMSFLPPSPSPGSGPEYSSEPASGPAYISALVGSRQTKYIECGKAAMVAKKFMWNHFAIVVSESTMKFYCNGMPCCESVVPKDSEVNFNPHNLMLNFLDVNESDSGCYHLAFDKIALWDRSLHDGEIAALRFGPFIPTPTTTARNSGGGDEVEPTTEAGPIPQIPTGKPEEQLNFILNLFDVTNDDTEIDLSAGVIIAGANAAVGILGDLRAGNKVAKENSFLSYDSSFYIEPPDDAEVILAIGVTGALFSVMASAGLEAPVSDGTPGARVDMYKFLNSLIDIDVETGAEDETNLDGISLLESLEDIMQSFFWERKVADLRSVEYGHIHCYEKGQMNRLQTNVYVTFSQSGKPGDAGVYMEYPAAAYTKFSRVRMVVCAVYDALPLSLPKKESSFGTVEVISPIMSVKVNYISTKLHKNVSFLIIHREMLKGEEAVCAFLHLDGASTEWRTSGCFSSNINATHTLCACNHLTNFALLMATDGLVLSTWHSKTAVYLTYAALSISVLCLFIGLIILTVYRKALKSKRIRIIRNTCVALLLAQLLFLLGDLALVHGTACKVVAVALHYLFLSVFCWMFIMGFQIYTKIRRAEKTKVDFLYYIIFGWGFPCGIVGIAVGTNTDGYGTTGACWLNPEDYTIWTFVGPALGILFFNCVVMVLVMRAFVNVKVNKDKDALDQIRASAKAVIIMLPVLGLTWIIGPVVQYHIVLVYAFIVLNGLQGMFLFIFHIMLNKEVKDAIQGKKNQVHSSSGVAGGFGTSTESGNSNSPDIKG